jgi:hypothetical protein
MRHSALKRLEGVLLGFTKPHGKPSSLLQLLQERLRAGHLPAYCANDFLYMRIFVKMHTQSWLIW